MNRFIQGLAVLACAALLAGCPKKEDAATPDSGGTATATSASSTPEAIASTVSPEATAAPEVLPAPPSGAPEVVDDPNTPPSHADHDKAATASIQKNNYKSELDKLEKEDLNSGK